MHNKRLVKYKYHDQIYKFNMQKQQTFSFLLQAVGLETRIRMFHTHNKTSVARFLFRV